MTPEERRRRILHARRIGANLVRDIREETKDKRKHPQLIAAGLLEYEQREWRTRIFKANGEPFLFDGVTRDLFPINLHDRDFAAWLSNRYGLVKGEQETALTTQIMHDWVWEFGERINVHRFSYYRVLTNVLYIDSRDGNIWRLDGAEAPKLVDNGADGVFFRVDRSNEDSLSHAEIGPHGILQKTLVDDLSYLKRDDQEPPGAHILGAWCHALAFGELMTNARPILLLEGQPGSGKTSAIKRINAMLTGRVKPIGVSEKKDDDFPTLLLRNHPICHLDNVDRKISWLEDAVALYCTGGSFPGRKKYSNDEEHEIRPSSFIAVSSANPVAFRRHDIAQRTYHIRLDKFREGTERDADDLVREIEARRDALVGEWLYTLNNMVGLLPTTQVTNPRSRMMGFERLFKTYIRAMGWAESDALEYAQIERVEFSSEEDPAVSVIDTWMETTDNNGRKILMTNLYTELRKLLGEDTAFSRAYPHENSFGRWLRQEGTEKLALKGYVLESWPNPNSKYSTRLYSITRSPA